MICSPTTTQMSWLNKSTVSSHLVLNIFPLVSIQCIYSFIGLAIQTRNHSLKCIMQINCFILIGTNSSLIERPFKREKSLTCIRRTNHFNLLRSTKRQSNRMQLSDEHLCFETDM